MTDGVITSAVAGYVIAGVAVVALNPVRAAISKAVSEVRCSPLANAFTARVPVPATKLLAFRLLLCTVSVSIWPVALWSSLHERALQRNAAAASKRKAAEGLTFSDMGGGGTIHCRQCGYYESIISFTHGETEEGEECFTAGLQCLSCGKFVTISSKTGSANQGRRRCDCDGQLSNEHVFFCPKCRSKQLTYDLEYIT